MGQRELQRKVSQKLASARWHLAFSLEEGRSAPQKAALLESTVWHAVNAYRSFLAEIATDEHMPVLLHAQLPRDAASLSASYADYLPAALAECANLEGQDSWLRRLLDYATTVEAVSAVAGAPSTGSMIGRSGGMPDCDQLREFLEQLDTLIERLRGDMLEF